MRYGALLIGFSALLLLVACQRSEPWGYGEPRHPDAEGAIARCEAELRDIVAPTREEREAMVEVACAEAYFEPACRHAIEAARELPPGDREEHMAVACGAAYCPLLTHLERTPYVCMPDGGGESWLRWQEIKKGALTLDLGLPGRDRIEHEAGRARLAEGRPLRRHEPVFSPDPPTAEQISRCRGTVSANRAFEYLPSGGQLLGGPFYDSTFWEACLEVLWPRRCSDAAFRWVPGDRGPDAVGLLGDEAWRALEQCAPRYCDEPALAGSSACAEAYERDFAELMVVGARLDWAGGLAGGSPADVAELFGLLHRLGFGQAAP